MSATLRRLGRLRSLPREVLDVHAADAAVALLGALVVRDLDDGTRVVARIVETEAYREDDPASHSHAKRTTRSEPMFWRPGTAYVYRSYGVHWCLNVSVEEEGVGAAVLLRAAIAVAGVEVVRSARPTARRDHELLRGPGNLTRGLAVDDRHDRGDLLVQGGGLGLATDGWRPRPDEVETGPRVGVSAASELPWRSWCHGVAEVSRYTRSPRARPLAVLPYDDGPTPR